MTNLLDKSSLEMDGHVLIKDFDTNEVLLDKHNAINFENMSVALANAIAVGGAGIEGIAYGNGGTTIDSVGNVIYNTPNVDSTNGSLHAQTYPETGAKTVTTGNDVLNSISVQPTPGEAQTDIVITSTLTYGEPAGQPLTDTGTNSESEFIFDELGIVVGTDELTQKFVSHIIFHPIEKSANRQIQVIYTLRITAGN
jgi:hypothetical protein